VAHGGADLRAAWDALDAAGLTDFLPHDLLVIQTVIIDSEYRRRELVLQEVRAMIRLHGAGCDFVVVNALPEGYGDSLDEFGRERLERHFARLGALKLPQPGFLVIELEEENAGTPGLLRALDANSARSVGLR
jgi:hypothetical protein